MSNLYITLNQALRAKQLLESKSSILERLKSIDLKFETNDKNFIFYITKPTKAKDPLQKINELLVKAIDGKIIICEERIATSKINQIRSHFPNCYINFLANGYENKGPDYIDI